MAKTKQKIKKTEISVDKKEELVGTRGRVFEGTVTKKFPLRVVIEYESTAFIKKYERFYKKKSKIHARVPKNISLQIGDYVKVKECRPLSKIIHHLVIEKIRSANSEEVKK